MGSGWAESLLDPGDPAALDATTLPFPNNVVVTLAQEFKGAAADGIDTVLMRPLKPTDPDVSLGVFAMDWIPGEYEMAGKVNIDPTLSTYHFGIHAFVKHGNREEGLLKHALLTKMVRLMLYRRESLRVRLSQLNEASFGVVERAQKWGIRQQRFMANELEGSFLFVSTTEFWLETETV